ncbi:ECF RNA polymerase sigma factor SigK [Botrimarina colliarenosi]|uniref:ECF RNA polymerase sigma factor SigK n=1 Tax=Botrimarina colliarenosi TaxID=2528001 RepID=A0A5C6A7D4_9BACT|nr:sigma-70 family RNA polymerase sigma factor [Botrimarina colliarenosi]TWT95346.1 ECF RNA polymerase sigma factor SigK [Botrimarina colliarenosi]
MRSIGLSSSSPGDPGVECPPDADDAALVGAVAEGDRNAFAALYDRHVPRVYGMALRIVRREAEAEAVVSDVFLSLWGQPQRFDPSRGPLRTYLIVLARSRALDRLRAGATRADHTEAAATDSGQSHADREKATRPDQQAMQLERSALVRAAVEQLDTKQRTPLELAYFEGLTHAEIADRLDEPLGTIKTRIRTAMSALRGVLRTLGGDRDGMP